MLYVRYHEVLAFPFLFDKERDILTEARRTTPPSSDRFKQARNRWVRAIRKAKWECWKQFLQANDPGHVWKSINAKPQMCAMPPILSSLSGQQYHTLEEKMEAIANIWVVASRSTWVSCWTQYMRCTTMAN
jgi:hypothetical protein